MKPILFFLKGGAANAPGLTRKRVTGKDGISRDQWVRAAERLTITNEAQQGRSDGEHNHKSSDFIKAPDGSIDFGEITPGMSKAMRRQAGKIRLTYGVQNLDGSGYGLAHIEARHGKEIRSSGFKSVVEFILDAVRHIDAIWMPGETSQLIAVQAGDKGKVLFLEIEQAKNKSGEYYRINSAFPADDKYVNRKERKEGWKTLWSRYPVSADASGATGFVDQSPKAGETTPTVSPQSGISNIPLALKKSNGDTLMQNEFNKSLGNKRILFFKSHVSAYTTKKGTFVPAHSDKRVKRLEASGDDRTADMFARPPTPIPNRDIPIEALKRPEDYTPDLFSGETKARKAKDKPLHEQTLGEYFDYAKTQMRADEFKSVKGALEDEHYEAICKHAKAKGKVHPDVLASLDSLKQWHFAKHYARDIEGHDGLTKSAQTRILFLKSHVKQFTRHDGTIVKEHDDKRTKKMQVAPVERQAAQDKPPVDRQGKDPEDVRGSAHGYGTHNMEEGDTINFSAGDFPGSGKIKSVGKDGAVVADESGRDHNVHWHEVTGFKAERGDGGGKKPPDDGDKPGAEGDAPKKEPKKPAVLGKQEAIPADKFNANDYAKSHDRAE